MPLESIIELINAMIIDKNRSELIQRVQAQYLNAIACNLTNNSKIKTLEKVLDEFDNPQPELKSEDVYKKIEEVFKHKIKR